eukprot:6206303-Pleurochrysis_carterae.AAC.2
MPLMSSGGTMRGGGVVSWWWRDVRWCRRPFACATPSHACRQAACYPLRLRAAVTLFSVT